MTLVSDARMSEIALYIVNIAAVLTSWLSLNIGVVLPNPALGHRTIVPVLHRSDIAKLLPLFHGRSWQLKKVI